VITSREAAAAAKKAGLDLSAADALSRLAGSPQEAAELAQMFSADAAPGQLTREDLAGMTSEAIIMAHDAGRLREVMGQK
jgi:hypothetical protein